MHKKFVFAKRVYISLLSTALILTTTVATTFAWVNVLANSSFEQFDVNIKSSDLSEYGIEISSTGETGSFSDSIDSLTVKKQILTNSGYSEDELSEDVYIERNFRDFKMEQCTTLPVVESGKIKKLGNFYTLDGYETKSYFKFDLYISAKKLYEKDISETNFNLDVYLTDKLMTGTVRDKLLTNSFTYPENFINPLSSTNKLENIVPLTAGYEVRYAKVNSETVGRVAFEKYPVVAKGDTDAYKNVEPISAVIYQEGYEYPVYNSDTDVYDFGSILPDEYNLSTGYFNSTEWKYATKRIKSVAISDEMYSVRGVGSNTEDLFWSTSTNHLIDSTNEQEQVGINTMMKITVYFWLEGWDADCFNAINNSPITVNLSFSTTNEE